MLLTFVVVMILMEIWLWLVIDWITPVLQEENCNLSVRNTNNIFSHSLGGL